MKTICLLPRKLGLGGPASFQARLGEAFRQQGVEVTFNSDDPDVSAILVVGGTRHLEELRRARKRGVRIVQRLNGMNWVHRSKYTGVKHFLRSEINNWILTTIRNSLADRVVYQSEFSQNWWLRVHGPLQVPERVIYNGVNLDEFTPLGKERRPADHFRMLLLEGHWGGGYEQGLTTAVQAAELLNQRLEMPLELMVVGEVPEALKRDFTNAQTKIVWLGVVTREKVPAIDRSAHVLYSADVNAACPNSVVEAMACGLPVVGYDTGSLPELVPADCGRIAAYGSDVWRLQSPDIAALVEAIEETLHHSSIFGVAARKRAELLFDIEQIARQYREMLLGD